MRAGGERGWAGQGGRVGEKPGLEQMSHPQLGTDGDFI